VFFSTIKKAFKTTNSYITSQISLEHCCYITNIDICDQGFYNSKDKHNNWRTIFTADGSGIAGKKARNYFLSQACIQCVGVGTSGSWKACRTDRITRRTSWSRFCLDWKGSETKCLRFFFNLILWLRTNNWGYDKREWSQDCMFNQYVMQLL